MGFAIFLLIGVGLVAGGVVAIMYFGRTWFTPQRDDLIEHIVQFENLELTVIEKGNLEAAENRDVTCQVKAGGRGSSFATTIKWVIDDGTPVLVNRSEHLRKKENGEVIKGDWVWPPTEVDGVPVERRSKPLNKEEKEALRKAKAGEALSSDEKAILEFAKKFEDCKVWSDLLAELDAAGLEDQERAQMISVNKAEAEVIAAKGQLEIVQSQNESDTKAADVVLTIARIDQKSFQEGEYKQQTKDIESRLTQLSDRAAYSKRMEAKGFLSSAAALADRLSFEKVQEEFRVLKDFTKEKKEIELKSKIDEAILAKKRVETQNGAKLATAKNDLKTKESLLEQEKEKLKDLREQITHCRIFAPKDGMVVYYQSQQERSGMGSQQSSIMQGEPVREGQKIIRIPSLNKMLVSTRVHEAMVSRVKSGMRVDVRVDAFPDQVLKAHVRSVATVAMPPEWRSSADVKMYLTMVEIDDTIPGLKPGMTAECTVRIEGTKTKVLTVPVQSIIGGAELGANRKIFVRHADGRTEERDIVLGLNNEKMAEVKSGLNEGDRVVLNPKVLVGERTKTRAPGELESKSGNGNGDAPKTGDSKAAPPAAPAAEGGSAAPKGKGKGGKGGGFNDPEMKKKMEEFNDKMKKATPQERKALLDAIPEAFREQTKQRFEAQGMKIAD